MYNIVIKDPRACSTELFSALVGFTLRIPVLGFEGFDYYGFVKNTHQLVVRTYLGKDQVIFRFLLNTPIETDRHLDLVSLDLEGVHRPDGIYPPHWYQKLGFYG